MKKNDVNEQAPLAIVGMACRFPKADDLREYWSNITNGIDCIEPIPDTHWRVRDYFDEDPKAPDRTYAQRGGFLRPTSFDPLAFGIPPKSLEATDTSQLLGMLVAREAMADAGYGAEREFDRDRVSVILGVTGALELVIPLGARLGHPIWRRALAEAGIEGAEAERIVQKISDGYVPWQEQSFPGLLGNVVAGRIANHLDLGGTNCVADAACASALSAVHLASLELWAGRADMVLTGGIDTFNDIFMYMCFSKTPALSPSGDARPFDSGGDGTILGEGLGVIALKRLADAQRDGDSIYAVLRSMGSSSDGKGNAIYAPNAAGQKKALERAYGQVGIQPRSIELIEGHGTGTRVGDATELKALSEVYGAAPAPWCAIGSVKSQIGHTKAAAGVAGLIKAALALKHKTLPPSIKVDKPLPALTGEETPFYLSGQARPWMPKPDHPRRAAVSAFGFGGSNFHCVLEEYGSSHEAIDWDGRVHIFAFSAGDRAGLRQRLATLPGDADVARLARAAAASRASFDHRATFRLVLIVEIGKTDTAKIKAHALTLLDKYADKANWSAPEGIYFGSGPRTGKLGVLFPGQGSQYIGMLRDLACRFPQMRTILEQADRGFNEDEFGEGRRLTDLIFPPTAYDKEKKRTQQECLRETQNAQPAIGAVSIGALKVLNAFGIEPEAAAGHSYGEITALCASSRFDTEILYLLSRLRGKLMAEGQGDRGAMLAVRAPVHKVKGLVDDHSLDLVLANKNAPDQVVLSGATHEIERATALLTGHQLSVKRLPVAAAFHSTLVAQASKPFSAQLRKIDFPEATIPVYSNTTARPYPSDSQEAKELLATQLTRPVEFVDEITNMYEDGVRIFLEVGPGARLTGLVKSILADRDHQALAVDASSGKRAGTFDLAKVLAQLAVLGYPLKLALWEEGIATEEPAAKKGFAVELCGANYTDPQTRERAARPLAPLQRETAVVAVPAAAAAASSPAPLPQSGSHAPAMAVPADRHALELAYLETSRQLAMLQQMQEETARIHLRFLEGQEAAQADFRRVIELGRGMPAATAGPMLPPARQPATFVPPASVPAAVAAQAPAPPVAPVVTAPAARTAPIDGLLLGIVSEKTGYPIEMLDVGMSLDADLGIDSIKRVEILSAVVEALPGAVPVQSDQMASLHTLADIIDYLGGAGAERTRPAKVADRQPLDLAPLLFAVVAEKTGYPAEMLDGAMSLDADLGIDSIKRVEILSALSESLPDTPPVRPEDMGRLQTLDDIVRYLVKDQQSLPVSPAPAVVPEPDRSSVAHCLLTVVAEKTGYPLEMLALEMSLDGDLGIDSIKRVEILSALQEANPELPAIAPDIMGSLTTLGDIVTHLAGEASVTAAPPQGRVAACLRAVVAEKTGYPEEMLEMHMSLDADLGIDSIKRVEIFSALQERLPGLPEIQPDALGGFATLAAIVDHLAGDLPAAAVKAQSAPRTEAAPDRVRLAAELLRIVAEKTGYPQDMLSLEMALEADLGIDSIKRVEILSGLAEALPGLRELKPDQLGGIRSLEEIVAFFAASPSTQVRHSAPPAVQVRDSRSGIDRYLVRPIAIGSDRKPLAVSGTICVLDDGSPWARSVIAALRERGAAAVALSHDSAGAIPADVAGLILLAPEDQQRTGFLKEALFLVQRAAGALRGAAGLLVSVTRLDGCFAMGALDSDRNPGFGGLAGLVKTAAREWPEVTCKAIDVAPGGDAEVLAARLADEIFRQGPLEVALAETGPQGLALQKQAVAVAESDPLQPGDVVIVSGGARGVTAACALALAESYAATLVLLGRSPAPSAAEPEWLAGLEDEAAVKAALLARNPGSKPREIGDTCRGIFQEREIRANLAEMSQAGARVVYRQVDLRDQVAVAAVIAEVRSEFGPIRGLLHGAGVLADKRIEEKTGDQFDLVYATKVGGFQALMAALADDDLRLMVLFSSSTARFGRSGQVDYAMANEVLNKYAWSQRASRPNCRVVALNWGPWDGGMVTPSLKSVFAAEGVGLIPLRAGALCLLAEIRADGPAEVVILGEGSQVPVIEPAPATVPGRSAGDEASLQAAFETRLSAEDHYYLKDHVIDGRAVVPAAVMVEWLAHAALHENPGLGFAGFEGFRVMKGIVLEGEATTLHFYTGKITPTNGHYLVPVALRCGDERAPFNARAQILLSAAPLPAPEMQLAKPAGRYPHAETIYDQLFHGPHFQGIERVEGCSEQGIAARVKSARPPREWVKSPLRGAWLSDPLALDCAFQMAILWCLQYRDAPSLPAYATSFRCYRRFPGKGVEVVLQVRSVKGASVIADIEFVDTRENRLIARMEGYECIADPKLAQAFKHKRLPERAAR